MTNVAAVFGAGLFLFTPSHSADLAVELGPPEECGICWEMGNTHWATMSYGSGSLYSEGHGWHDDSPLWRPYTCTVTHGVCVVVLDDGTEVDADDLRLRVLDSIDRRATEELVGFASNEKVILSEEHQGLLILGCLDRVHSVIPIETEIWNSMRP